MTLNVSDDFETGKYNKCPLNRKSYYENYQCVEETNNCSIECTPLNCPVMVDGGEL